VVVDVITLAKNFCDRLRDVDSVWVENRPLPLVKPVAVNTADATGQLSDCFSINVLVHSRRCNLLQTFARLLQVFGAFFSPLGKLAD